MATEPTSELVASVRDQSRAVIDAEMRRLARRDPSLRPDVLDVIDAALVELVEAMFLARVRGMAQHAERLQRLFDVMPATPNGDPGAAKGGQ